MQIKVKDLGGLKRSIHIVIPESVVQKAYLENSKLWQKKSKIDGFRMGKAPLHTVQKHFEQRINSEILEKILPASFEDAVKQEKLKAATAPEFGEVEFDAKKPLSFTANFEIYPEIQAPNLKKLNLQAKPVEVTADEIKKMQKSLQEQAASFEKTDAAAKDNDKVHLSFEAFEDGNSLAKNDEETYQIGSKRWSADFDAGLLGVKAGEEKSLKVCFPENYFEPNLRGKEVRFDVQVKEVEQAILPEVNEEFYKKFDPKITEQKAFEAELKKQLEAIKTEENKKHYRQELQLQLQKQLKFPVPKEVHQKLLADRIKNMEQNSTEIKPKELGEQVTQDLQWGYFVTERAKAHNIQVERDEVLAVFARSAMSIGLEPAKIIKTPFGQQLLGNVRDDLVEKNLLDHIIEELLK